MAEVALRGVTKRWGAFVGVDRPRATAVAPGLDRPGAARPAAAP